MEGIALLTVLSTAMFLGCYIAGSVPLAVSFSEAKLRFISVFGAGLLVGTALAVIIPEGVGSIYSAELQAHSHGHGQEHLKEIALGHEKQAENILDDSNVAVKSLGKMPANPPDRFRLPQENESPADGHRNEVESDHQIENKKPDVKTEEDVDTKNTGHNRVERAWNQEDNSSPPDKRKLLDAETHHAVDSHEHHQPTVASKVPSRIDVHSQIGLALTTGFVFMLIVDQISKAGSGVADVEYGRNRQPRYKMTATIGLVVHAAADGIALGAASVVSQTEIQFIVFMAIMLHKAPAAFGLVTFLMHEGLEKARVRRHLLIFSLAAPILAVITYLGIVQGGGQRFSSVTTTGILMLFSAGTFLYVATVHVLPEMVQQSAPSPSSTTPSSAVGGGGLGHSHGNGGGAFKLNELIALIAGALLPSVLTLGHSHSH